jgi:hypothetical protein
MIFFGLFAGTTISNDGSFLIVLNAFQSFKSVDDQMLRSACSGFLTVAVNKPFLRYPFNRSNRFLQ